MRKNFYLFLLFVTVIYVVSSAQGVNYYVSENGSDTNNGLSPATAFLTLRKAADLVMPGDTVFIMNGTYTNEDSLKSIVTLHRSGTLLEPVVFINYPDHNPRLKFNGLWGILIEGASHLIIQGLEIEGNNAQITQAYAESQYNNPNNPLTSGSGIGIIYRQQDSVFSEHIIIRNNKIHNCGKHAIFSLYADWVQIEGNEIFNNCFYSPTAPSAIVQYRPRRSDDDPRMKMRIEKNKIYNNRNLIPLWPLGEIVGGHAIEINNTFNGGLNLCFYPGKTLVANNMIFDNGGAGIYVTNSYYVHIIHNTLVSNSSHPDLWIGELHIEQCYNAYVKNNILYANQSAIAISGNNNLDSKGDFNLYNPLWINQLNGLNDVHATDPLFVFLSANPDLADFRLLQGSPAIDAGTTDSLVMDDFYGTLRPMGSASDIGAFELVASQQLQQSQITGNFTFIQTEQGLFILSPTLLKNIQLFNYEGQMTYSAIVNDTQAWLPFDKQASSIYILRIITENEIIAKKIFTQF